MNTSLQVNVNGVSRTVEIEPEMMVIDLIRDIFDLTGTKRGCDNATCGSCVIILNGRAVKSCNTPAIKAAGATILTVEGLANGMEIHPVQQAFIESGAVQCGFCTPGIVMELAALLGTKPSVSETEVINALNKHLCRCTGYEPIRDGALLAQQIFKKVQITNG